MIALRFTHADAVQAYDDWGANCGPGALAAVTGCTLAEVRPAIPGFAEKRYTNPTMMLAALGFMRVSIRKVPPRTWPAFGLARVQWEGPWLDPGVPAGAAYGNTHWVGAHVGRKEMRGSDQPHAIDERWSMIRVGKKNAGALLDGVEHREMPHG